jgi:hypothetical protein
VGLTGLVATSLEADAGITAVPGFDTCAQVPTGIRTAGLWTAHAKMRHSDARITLGIYLIVGNSQRDALERLGELLRPEFWALTHPNSR